MLIHIAFSPKTKLDSTTVYGSFALFTHLQVQSGVQAKDALAHLHLVHEPLQVHFVSSLQAFETSGMVSHIGTHDPPSFFQENLSGDGTACCECSLVDQIPAWKIERWTCCKRASF